MFNKCELIKIYKIVWKCSFSILKINDNLEGGGLKKFTSKLYDNVRCKKHADALGALHAGRCCDRAPLSVAERAMQRE